MHSLFMHTSDSPLTRLFKFAPNTFATGDFEPDTSFGVRFFEHHTRIARVFARAISSERTITGHGLEPDATAHRSSADISDVSMRGRPGEGSARFRAIHFVTSHSVLLDFEDDRERFCQSAHLHQVSKCASADRLLVGRRRTPRAIEGQPIFLTSIRTTIPAWRPP